MRMSNERYLAFASPLECAYSIGTFMQILDIFMMEWKFPDGTKVDEYCSRQGAKCSVMPIVELGSYTIAYLLMLNIVPTVLMIRATIMHKSIFFDGKFQDVSNSTLIRILGVAACTIRIRLLVFVLLAIIYVFELSVLGALSILNVR